MQMTGETAHPAQRLSSGPIGGCAVGPLQREALSCRDKQSCEHLDS